MRIVRRKHVVRTVGLILLACWLFAFQDIPSWAVAFAAVLGVVGPIVVYLFSDEPPTDPNGNVILAPPK